jgi:hypothetical protein
VSLFGNSLTRLIDQLESSIPNVNEGFSWGFDVERHDWRPVWALCREIQETFKGYRDFDTKEQRQEAWQRFNELRQRASRLADIEKEKFASQSERLKTEIVDEARATYWSKSADFFIGAVLGHTDVEEMQDLQRRLNDAGRKLSENKARMTREDKEMCFQAISDSRKSHDSFWEKYREIKQHRHEEFQRKRSEWISSVQANISKNQDKLSSARDALSRTRQRIDELQDKLSETNSSKWEGIYSEWIAEARAKEASIEESIERLQSWISEDEDKLNSAR